MTLVFTVLPPGKKSIAFIILQDVALSNLHSTNLETSSQLETSLIFQRSRSEVVFHLLSMFFCLLAGAFAGYAALVKAWPWLWVMILGALGGLGFLISAVKSLRKYHLITQGEEVELRWKSWGLWQSVVGKELLELKTIPCWRRTLLVTSQRTVVLPHQLTGCEYLLDRLRKARPEVVKPLSEKDSSQELILKVSLLPSLFYVLFMAGVAGAAWALVPIRAQYFTLLFMAFPLFRLLWRTPRRYLLTEKGITIFYWASKKVWLWSEVESWSEDTYASTAANFYLMKFLWQGGNVILDEGLLLTPLRPYKEWILNRFFSAGNSVYF